MSREHKLNKKRLVDISDSITAIQTQLEQLKTNQKHLSEQCLLDKKSFHAWTTNKLEPALQVMHTDVKSIGLLHTDVSKTSSSLATMVETVDDVTSTTKQMLVARANDTKKQLDAIKANGNRGLEQAIKHKKKQVNKILKDHDMASESELLDLGNQLCQIGDLSDLHIKNTSSNTSCHTQKLDSQEVMRQLEAIKKRHLPHSREKYPSIAT